MDKNVALITAGLVFSIVAIIHILRLYYKFSITIAGKDIPMQASTIGLIISFALALWMFIASGS
ncbi:MAG: hypothetical protein A3F11_11805 [Gammaproteobacteria bacterium RIFCSPHIGHO2_12_FULL_37_14]|nr:MAG: hypothetical protein A3F11_11805 [Gammaproteobacteria bacterium RIFCSPHIGHO2_12_FULL_37_14]